MSSHYVTFICSMCGRQDSGKYGTYKVEKKLCTACCIEESRAPSFKPGYEPEENIDGKLKKFTIKKGDESHR